MVDECDILEAIQDYTDHLYPAQVSTVHVRSALRRLLEREPSAEDCVAALKLWQKYNPMAGADLGLNAY